MSARLDAIGIVTANMSRSLEFYAILGVPVPQPTDDHAEATLPNGLRLMWDTLELVKQIDPSWQSPVGHRTGMAFLCDSPADVDATYQKVLDAGFESSLEPWDAFWGQRYAQVCDPDGNKVDLFAPLG